MNIVGIRVGHGLTQAQVAAMVGVDQTTVAKWESGKAMPRVATLKKLARIFGCTIDDLLKEAE